MRAQNAGSRVPAQVRLSNSWPRVGPNHNAYVYCTNPHTCTRRYFQRRGLAASFHGRGGRGYGLRAALARISRWLARIQPSGVGRLAWSKPARVGFPRSFLVLNLAFSSVVVPETALLSTELINQYPTEALILYSPTSSPASES